MGRCDVQPRFQTGAEFVPQIVAFALTLEFSGHLGESRIQLAVFQGIGANRVPKVDRLNG